MVDLLHRGVGGFEQALYQGRDVLQGEVEDLHAVEVQARSLEQGLLGGLVVGLYGGNQGFAKATGFYQDVLGAAAVGTEHTGPGAGLGVYLQRGG